VTRTSRWEGHTGGLAALFLITFVWSTTFPVAKAAFEHLTPSFMTAVRFALATLFLANRFKGLTRAEARLGSVLGLLQFVSVAAVFQGLQTIGAGRSAFLISLSVFMVPLGNRLLGHPVRRVQVAAAVVALAGVLLLTGAWESGSFTRGDAWVVLSAATFAVYTLVIEWAGPQENPVRGGAFQILIIAILSVVWCFGEGLPAEPVAALKAVWISVLYLAFCAICTTSLQAWGQRYVSAQESALIFIFEPVLATLWAYWFLGEVLPATALPGAALILVANVWSQLARGKG
jgi:drug/metabolite transporter (DMT)-like permease